MSIHHIYPTVPYRGLVILLSFLCMPFLASSPLYPPLSIFLSFYLSIFLSSYILPSSHPSSTTLQLLKRDYWALANTLVLDRLANEYAILCLLFSSKRLKHKQKKGFKSLYQKKVCVSIWSELSTTKTQTHESKEQQICSANRSNKGYSRAYTLWFQPGHLQVIRFLYPNICIKNGTRLAAIVTSVQLMTETQSRRWAEPIQA